MSQLLAYLSLCVKSPTLMHRLWSRKYGNTLWIFALIPVIAYWPTPQFWLDANFYQLCTVIAAFVWVLVQWEAVKYWWLELSQVQRSFFQSCSKSQQLAWLAQRLSR
ncbi:hypothetical protein [Paraferrimonas sedimenticola]|uniref:Uncharacterized protein n=1 Tax=Paraferrimonas sedimenticola TaxID=375674 RepID=A0AA37VT91_9GAMM|nr:hypothetical protein [Paraferrimonas sedimenticola]GLP95259.1 hypothetical protein GCM10007895_05650 [Paraferrimonas sedimenticola]